MSLRVAYTLKARKRKIKKEVSRTKAHSSLREGL